MSNKIIPIFGKNEYGTDHVALMGGKGAALADLHNLDIAVPPFVNLTTDAYREFLEAGDKYVFCKKLAIATVDMFNVEGMKIGKEILVSVRSGSPVSMPGMMDTILNVGLSLDTQEIWEEKFGARWFWDSYSRLLLQLCDAQGMKDLPKHEASNGFRTVKKIYPRLREAGIDSETFVSVTGALTIAIHAVFKSWLGDRAIAYREINDIDESLGTACSIQRMVFGNLNDMSGTGVMFSRDPASGINLVTGEFLIKAQGEDVVDGSTTPEPLDKLKDTELGQEISSQLLKIAEKLELYYDDMQDVEFTIEDGKLWILQTRSGKRTSEAAFKIVVDMVDEELITESEAVERITLDDWHNVIGGRIISAPDTIHKGLAAGSGIAQGRAVFTSEDAEAATDDVILVRPETTPNDIKGMYAAKGILTFEGGITSHAAVVARGMNTPCIVGAINLNGKINEGDIVTLDSSTGKVWINEEILLGETGMSDDANIVMYWAQKQESVMCRRARYLPFTILPILWMTDEEFEAMIEEVVLTGKWLEGLILDMEPSFSFPTDDNSGLSELANLALPGYGTGKLNERSDRILKLFKVGIKTVTMTDIETVNSPAELEKLTGKVVRIGRETWKEFLGTWYEGVLDALKENGTSNFVIDFAVTEDEIIEKIFGE